MNQELEKVKSESEVIQETEDRVKYAISKNCVDIQPFLATEVNVSKLSIDLTYRLEKDSSKMFDFLTIEMIENATNFGFQYVGADENAMRICFIKRGA
jgi:lysylphosphatidylglycerol synthetase-like protein (DUF2156 family)